ncbi:MAG: hypothetical protein J6Y80_02735 [Victivallales bacterium]|nr:hypothetical protein [Victivallales bacterium]
MPSSAHKSFSRNRLFLLVVGLLALWVTVCAVCAARWSSGRVPEDARKVLQTVVPGGSHWNLNAAAAALAVDAFTVGTDEP